jgi:two-component system, cell cycle sensor histidine kinase and response regulator CckA
LLDLMMPILDGSATIEALHTLDPQVRIVAMTGLSSAEMRQKAARIGAHAFLPKPFLTQELLKVVSEALADSSFQSSQSQEEGRG